MDTDTLSSDEVIDGFEKRRRIDAQRETLRDACIVAMVGAQAFPVLNDAATGHLVPGGHAIPAIVAAADKVALAAYPKP